jgi:hypothetical protein
MGFASEGKRWKCSVATPSVHSPIEYLFAQFIGEFQDLRHELREATHHLPKPGRRWITTAQLAAEIGVTGRTVANWISQGRFPESTYKKRPRGEGFIYLLDRTPALAAAERIVCGEA